MRHSNVLSYMSHIHSVTILNSYKSPSTCLKCKAEHHFCDVVLFICVVSENFCIYLIVL